MSKSPHAVFGVLFLTVFLDIVGFSILFPLFPELLDHYFQAEGADSMLGRLVARLQDFAGDDKNAVITLFGGLLGSVYGVLQFVFAVFWGGLSDRIGRRPTLLVTLAGTMIACGMWFFAGSFAVLVASRILAGAMAGNIATASAAVADITSGEDRSKGMGMIGAAIGLGFIFGPVIGALTASIDLGGALGVAPAGAFAINPFSGPALASLVLAAINLLWVARRFGETLPAEKRGQHADGRSINPFRRLSSLSFPGVKAGILIYFLFLIAFAAIEFTLTFLAAERMGYGHGKLALMFVYVGVIIIYVQGREMRRLPAKYGERKLARAGLLLTIPGFILIGLAHSALLLYLGLTFMAIGSSLTMPCLSGLVSRYCPADRQGLAMGTFRSMGSLSRAIGPVLGAMCYWKFGSASPYFLFAASLLIPFGLALTLPPVPEETTSA